MAAMTALRAARAEPVRVPLLIGGAGRLAGREGPRYAIRDMTEERLVVFNM
jgi:hypothetical protein